MIRLQNSWVKYFGFRLPLRYQYRTTVIYPPHVVSKWILTIRYPILPSVIVIPYAFSTCITRSIILLIILSVCKILIVCGPLCGSYMVLLPENCLVGFLGNIYSVHPGLVYAQNICTDPSFYFITRKCRVRSVYIVWKYCVYVFDMTLVIMFDRSVRDPEISGPIRPVQSVCY